MIGVEGWLQLIPLWGPAPKDTSVMILHLHKTHFLQDRVLSTVLPGQSPAGSRTGAELQWCVITNLLSGANWSGLQDMLHQVTIATDDIQRVDNRLPGLICEEDAK